jgi:GNAT superfamily N-acetyltransferase
MDLRIRPADPSQAGELDQLLAIYREAIPVKERKTPEQVAEMAARPDYQVLAGFVGDELVAFSIAYAAADEPWSLFEYLGVSRPFRGRGLGAALFRRVVASDAVRGRTLLLEVDSEWTGAADIAVRRARKAFYRREGCREIEGLRYRLPLASSGPDPIMDLMVFAEPAPVSIRKAELAGWLSGVYRQVYATAADDPRVAQMLESLPEDVRLI